MIVLLGYVLFPLIKYILYPDYYMYDKFIEDLRQVIPFILVTRRISRMDIFKIKLCKILIENI